MRQLMRGVPKQPDRPARDLSWWGRVKLGYQAFSAARRLPFKLVTGTEVLVEHGARPSQIEEVLSVWVTYLDENGQEAKRRMSLFS